MSGLAPLIADLALILIAAGAITLIFKWLKQPLVLGYVVAGLLISQHFGFFPSVSDMENVTLWADIGVIFLLFGLGLEFSFKKLMKVGGSASITAITEVISMLVIGYVVGYFLGWSHIDSIFLGGMLAMSSTTIIIKAFDDLNLRAQKFTNIVFGVLVVEDLVAILMLVLLPTLAISQTSVGIEMIESFGSLVFFLALWFVFGIFLLPIFFKYMRKFMNDETLLIVSIGLCLGMVVLANKTGFSSALGAFIMGSILAETIDGEKIEHLTKPVKDLFGAIFFVSVGMMVDPAMLVTYAGPIIIVTLATYFGKMIFSSLGVLISGQNLKVSMQSGFSLAQIGEFAFIIAALGLSLGVTSDFLYPVVVAVSVITTFTTPYTIKVSEPSYNLLKKLLPERVMVFLDNFGAGSQTVNRQSDWRKVLKSNVMVILIYSVMLVFISVASVRYILPFLKSEIPGSWSSVIAVAATLLLMAPFLSALLVSKLKTPAFLTLWNDRKFNRGPLFFIVLVRITLAAFFVAYVVFSEFTTQIGIVIILTIFVIIVALFSKTLRTQYAHLEKQFMTNLNAKSFSKLKKEDKNVAQSLMAQNVHLGTFDIIADSVVAGKTLSELNFREKYGVSIVSIIRAGERHNIPRGTDRLYPADQIVVLGTDEQMELFKKDIEGHAETPAKKEDEVVLEQFVVDENSYLVGKTISQCVIRDVSSCLVVGVDRDDESIMHPKASFEFHEGDVVWVVGERANIRSLSKTCAMNPDENGNANS
ncbi:cation:proton antiporter [Methanolapillus millepedarum]|uniref:Glutathione-regulated potassium-efflux system protein KefB n=1 Tax=Methanolapillus millepedarum TaxID=3028296 RepID=A0AA96ZTU6_9EURY|nr:Glutathione-regulated potassium-efflux system protein KefB [Methanosarcinaceae archaeon Ac7]